MQKMVRFKLNRECREISVNPGKVLYVSHYDNTASSLHFSKDCFVRVQGAVDEVTQRIEVALCDTDTGVDMAAHRPGAEVH